MIYFVRHGQTDANVNKIASGQQDIPLNQNGIEQAKLTATYLQDINFAACFCSPLTRAKQSCAEILKFHRGLVPQYDNRLKARNYGKMQGQPEAAFNFNRWKVGAADEQTRVLEIETITDFYQRVAGFFDEVLKKYPQQNVLVISHSCVGRVAAGYFNGVPSDNDFSNLKIPNAKVVMFDK